LSLSTIEEPVMIRGLHAMFYSSGADELRAFMRDKVPGDFDVQLYQPSYTK
jgi:hypothetical protein